MNVLKKKTLDELRIDDIDILDMIIKKVLEHKTVTLTHLPAVPIDEKQIFSVGISERKPDIDKFAFYKRYIEIIEVSGLAQVNITRYNHVVIKITPVVTQRFYDNGGFKNLYEKQQEELRRTEILKRKEIDDAKISKWTKRTYWFTFAIAILGLILAVWAFVRTL